MVTLICWRLCYAKYSLYWCYDSSKHVILSTWFSYNIILRAYLLWFDSKNYSFQLAESCCSFTHDRIRTGTRARRREVLYSCPTHWVSLMASTTIKKPKNLLFPENTCMWEDTWGHILSYFVWYPCSPIPPHPRPKCIPQVLVSNFGSYSCPFYSQHMYTHIHTRSHCFSLATIADSPMQVWLMKIMHTHMHKKSDTKKLNFWKIVCLED